MSHQHDSSQDLLDLIRGRRASIRGFVSKVGPRSQRLLVVSIVSSAIVSALTAGPALGGTVHRSCRRHGEGRRRLAHLARPVSLSDGPVDPRRDLDQHAQIVRDRDTHCQGGSVQRRPRRTRNAAPLRSNPDSRCRQPVPAACRRHTVHSRARRARARQTSRAGSTPAHSLAPELTRDATHETCSQERRVPLESGRQRASSTAERGATLRPVRPASELATAAFGVAYSRRHSPAPSTPIDVSIGRVDLHGCLARSWPAAAARRHRASAGSPGDPASARAPASLRGPGGAGPGRSRRSPSSVRYSAWTSAWRCALAPVQRRAAERRFGLRVRDLLAPRRVRERREARRTPCAAPPSPACQAPGCGR